MTFRVWCLYSYLVHGWGAGTGVGKPITAPGRITDSWRRGQRGSGEEGRAVVRYREVAGCQKGVLGRQGGAVRYREVAGCQKEVLGKQGGAVTYREVAGCQKGVQRQGGAVRYREVALGCSGTEKGAAEARAVETRKISWGCIRSIRDIVRLQGGRNECWVEVGS